jgi:hypothetical protein
MKTVIARTALLACAAALAVAVPAQAQVTYQGVTFTTSVSGNVLTLEIDAAHPTGDWSTANYLGAVALQSIGNFSSVTFTGPAGTGAWTTNAAELTANGCSGAVQTGSRLCSSGTYIPLSDDMLFQFAFTGTPNLQNPTVKVEMFASPNSTDKTGSLLSMHVPVGQVPEPGTYAMLLAGLGLLGLARRRGGRA